MAPSRVTDSDVLAVWKGKEVHRRHVRVAKAKFRAGQRVRISKEKMMFAKGAEENFSTEIFRITKVIDRRPRPQYELEAYRGPVLSRGTDPCSSHES